MVWFHLLRPMHPIPNSTKITVFTEATAAKCFCSSARTWISAPISTAPQCSLLPTQKGCLGCLWGHHSLCRQDPDGIYFSRNTGTLIASSSKETNLTYDQGHMSPIVLVLLVSQGNQGLVHKFYIQIKINRLSGDCPQKILTAEVLAALLMPPGSLSHSVLLFGCPRTSDARSCSSQPLTIHH